MYEIYPTNKKVDNELQRLVKQNEKPFDSFEDIKNRISLLPDPKRAIIKKIIADIKGEEKHKLFNN